MFEIHCFSNQTLKGPETQDYHFQNKTLQDVSVVLPAVTTMQYSNCVFLILSIACSNHCAIFRSYVQSYTLNPNTPLRTNKVLSSSNCKT